MFLQFGFGFGDIIDQFASTANDVLNSLLGILTDFANYLFSVLLFFGNLFKTLFDFLGRLVKSIRDFFKHLWQQGWRGVVAEIWGFAKKLFGILKRIFGPIICALQAVIVYEENLFNLYLRPVLLLIQHARSFLVLLRFLHLKFAARLDARLSALEAKIQGSFFAVLREINTVRQTFALFIDPFGLFNPVVLFNSIYRSIGDLWNALHVAQERPLSASELESQGQDRAIFKQGAYVASRDKPYFDALAARVDIELQSITGG